jgi:hypothetical protein
MVGLVWKRRNRGRCIHASFATNPIDQGSRVVGTTLRCIDKNIANMYVQYAVEFLDRYIVIKFIFHLIQQLHPIES